ncbi:hypothetical protein GPECTOR_484g424 [Gonium pectorale]|uniref:Uncharacterized protein n=1 Tax=Gonium pectorale TaxID=33097 RepID=A0A150FUX1_GONPE|nr:hypothetical protein GPECTOR_484g424 [Gonium pectorale]|eukprot:KXZ41412.1 hypothetical protein GPECTOR_484g424 [Gonium pectorale]
MSYPVYHTFTPHSIFDWGSYAHLRVKRGFDSVAPNEPFFADMNKAFGNLLEFSGSTRAILEDGGKSYIAVGHLRAHARCFHSISSSDKVPLTCTNLAARDVRPWPDWFDFKHWDGRSYAHHRREYAMFLYRFSATPPYEITHLSQAFTLCSYHHHGVIFPTGLERVGPERDYLIAYGDSDRYSRFLIMSAPNVDKLLQPIREVRSAGVHNYVLCTLPCAVMHG